MEEMWRSMYISMQESGFSDSMMFSAVSSIIFFIFYYVHCWLFFFADKTGVLERYAIRSGKARQPPSELYWSAIVENSVDAFLLKPVAFYVMHAYVVGSSISMVDPVPSGLTVFAQVVGLSLIYSTSFYWLHRTFHEVKFLYKHVHKRHHAFHQTVGFAAQYFHPGETLANIMFILTAVILVKPHFVGFCGFLATFLMEIVDAHSGYDVRTVVVLGNYYIIDSMYLRYLSIVYDCIFLVMLLFHLFTYVIYTPCRYRGQYCTHGRRIMRGAVVLACMTTIIVITLVRMAEAGLVHGIGCVAQTKNSVNLKKND